MKKFKKVFSLTIALLVVFSCCSAVLAAEENDTYDHLPQVFVTGIGSAKIFFEDDPDQTSLFWPVDTNRLIKNLGNIGKYMKKAVENRDSTVLRTVVFNYLVDSFGMLAFKPDGSCMDGVTVEPTVLAEEEPGKFTFYYDSRQAPTTIAPQLHDYIHLVMKETGSDKIELVGSSYGANAVTAYIYEYPEDYKYIDSLLLCVPSIGGMNFFGELLSGNFAISPIGLCDFINQMIEFELIPDFFYLMEEAGVLEIFLEAILVPALRESIYAAVIDFVREDIATVPALWVCVTDEHFEPALRYIYGDNYRDPNHTYAKLISEMTHFHYDVANHAAEIYLEAEAQSDLELSIITKFDRAAIPLTSGPNTMDDGLVTVPVSSFGATCTTYGAQLPADYKQAKYPEYNFMSPEWDIDASTGAVPFRTWYIKGLGHAKKNEDYKKLVDEIVYKDLTVFTDPNRPQYLTVSEDDPEMLEPLIVKEEKQTLYHKLFEIIRKIVLFPINIINRITGKVK